MGNHEPRCRHGNVVCSRCVIVSDAAKRMSDQINGRITFTPWDQLINSWMAFRLNDGGTDGVLYESKQAAVRHQPDERWAAYFCFRNAPGGVTPKDCQVFLNLHRHLYDNGGRLTDPDDSHGGPDLILSSRGYDFMSKRRLN